MVEPYAKLELIGLSARAARAKSATTIDAEERAALRETMVVDKQQLETRRQTLELSAEDGSRGGREEMASLKYVFPRRQAVALASMPPLLPSPLATVDRRELKGIPHVSAPDPHLASRQPRSLPIPGSNSHKQFPIVIDVQMFRGHHAASANGIHFSPRYLRRPTQELDLSDVLVTMNSFCCT